jgi:hypothetical protein
MSERAAPSQQGSCNVAGCTAPVGPGGEEVSDSFYFTHQPLAGNGSITVRVTSLTGEIPVPRQARPRLHPCARLPAAVSGGRAVPARCRRVVRYLGLVGLLGLGVATAIRDSAVAIGVVLGLLYLFPVVAATVANPHWQRRLEQFTPMSAGLSIQATTGLRGLPTSPWAGLGVLAAWAAGAMLAGGLLLATAGLSWTRQHLPDPRPAGR